MVICSATGRRDDGAPPSFRGFRQPRVAPMPAGRGLPTAAHGSRQPGHIVWVRFVHHLRTPRGQQPSSDVETCPITKQKPRGSSCRWAPVASGPWRCCGVRDEISRCPELRIPNFFLAIRRGSAIAFRNPALGGRTSHLVRPKFDLLLSARRAVRHQTVPELPARESLFSGSLALHLERPGPPRGFLIVRRRSGGTSATGAGLVFLCWFHLFRSPVAANRQLDRRGQHPRPALFRGRGWLPFRRICEERSPDHPRHKREKNPLMVRACSIIRQALVDQQS